MSSSAGCTQECGDAVSLPLGQRWRRSDDCGDVCGGPLLVDVPPRYRDLDLGLSRNWAREAAAGLRAARRGPCAAYVNAIAILFRFEWAISWRRRVGLCSRSLPTPLSRSATLGSVRTHAHSCTVHPGWLLGAASTSATIPARLSTLTGGFRIGVGRNVPGALLGLAGAGHGKVQQQLIVVTTVRATSAGHRWLL